MIRVRRALLSVSDKHGLVEFATGLRRFGVELLSTGGTASALAAAGIPVKQVSDVTGFPEIMDGRVKTLHPLVHGGLLGINDNPTHVEQMRTHGIETIDMVVVNLYPFEQTIAKSGVTREEAIENIDIGGPAMIRSAAKNHRYRAVVVDPARYHTILAELERNSGELNEDTCFDLAQEAFAHTARYDAAIAAYLLGHRSPNDASETLRITVSRELDLRYGENPHQSAALFGNFTRHFQKLHGKELSYNNILDMSAAAALVVEFDNPAVAIIKHTNPCGVAVAETLADAYVRALATDSTSAFGGIVAVNRQLDERTATEINKIFTEVVIAPDFAPGVLDLLRAKKDRRLVKMQPSLRTALQERTVRSVPGGYLVQDSDSNPALAEIPRVVTKRAPTDDESRALRFAWIVAKHVKSNAIVYTTADRTLGIGAGQMSRVDSSHIAVEKAKQARMDLKGSVVASDAYFPFADGLLEAVNAGATAVIQPGGSIRDAEVIAAADEHGIAMVFTGTSHFRH